MDLASCLHLILWFDIICSICWETPHSVLAPRISLQKALSLFSTRISLLQTCYRLTNESTPHTHTHTNTEKGEKARVFPESQWQRGCMHSPSSAAVLCCAASNLSVSTICPYKIIPSLPSATRDWICNHGNKIQVQQHNHHCFHENREHREGNGKERFWNDFMSPRSTQDPHPSSFSTAQEKARSTSICCTR